LVPINTDPVVFFATYVGGNGSDGSAGGGGEADDNDVGDGTDAMPSPAAWALTTVGRAATMLAAAAQEANGGMMMSTSMPAKSASNMLQHGRSVLTAAPCLPLSVPGRPAHHYLVHCCIGAYIK
jgi:hypothetical protein